VKVIVLFCGLFIVACASATAGASHNRGLASWYGEEHRGKLMANGRKFDPDKLTAASWFYPLGTLVCVTVQEKNLAPGSIVIPITDRGPDKDLVRKGRIIDLSRAAFQKIAPAEWGLVRVTVEPVTDDTATLPRIVEPPRQSTLHTNATAFPKNPVPNSNNIPPIPIHREFQPVANPMGWTVAQQPLGLANVSQGMPDVAGTEILMNRFAIRQ
jgi:peptidoglycan lytic transglycosylase